MYKRQEKEDNNLVLEKAYLRAQKVEAELVLVKEELRFDQLELIKKNNEIEISAQTKIITDLELAKNKYANFTLALLLVVCLLLILFIYRRFVISNKRNKKLSYLAERDPLTNCYNRRALYRYMDEDFAGDILPEKYCILMVDIDHFKRINDTYGHDVGDGVICEVASILHNCVREKDIVVRYGGEEYCIVLEGMSVDQAMILAEKIRLKVESSKPNSISVTCSLGLTSMKFGANSSSELINQADIALYQSKSLGRNKVTLWDPSFNNVTVSSREF